jgi:DNA mismatch endonuclease, patch repair protein
MDRNLAATTRRLAQSSDQVMAGPNRVWVSTSAGRHLSGRSRVDTTPERTLRRAVHSLGLRFRLHRKVARGCTPDFVLPRFRIAVFVDGCFWHGCERHGRKTFDGPNAALWEDKLRRNRERDERANSLAREAGWTVLRLWECDVLADPQAAARLVAASAGVDSRCGRPE